MNEKIKNVYDKMIILLSFVNNCSEFRIAFKFSDIGCEDFMTASCSCSKYAKFLINDFKSLENKYGSGIYERLDGAKLCAMFAISETHSWFSRKELIQFIESELG